MWAQLIKARLKPGKEDELLVLPLFVLRRIPVNVECRRHWIP